MDSAPHLNQDSANDVLRLLRHDEEAFRTVLDRLINAEDLSDWTRACMRLEAELTLHLLAEEHALLLRMDDSPVAQSAAGELRRSAGEIFQAASDVLRARRMDARLVMQMRRVLETHVALHALVHSVCQGWAPLRRHEAGKRFAARKLELMELRVTADPIAAHAANRTPPPESMNSVLRPVSQR